jgi:hypothetical protein
MERSAAVRVTDEGFQEKRHEEKRYIENTEKTKKL